MVAPKPLIKRGHSVLYVTADGILHAASGDQVADFRLAPAELLALASAFVDIAEMLRVAGIGLYEPPAGSA